MTHEKKAILDRLGRLGYLAYGTECDRRAALPGRWSASARKQDFASYIERFARCEMDALNKLLQQAERLAR